MKSRFKLLMLIVLYLSHLSLSVAQNDSLKRKQHKKHIYISATAGIPVYNKFGYKNDNDQSSYNIANSKKRMNYNLNIDFDFNHFTLNFLTNYSENQFNGNSYKLIGYDLNAGSHNGPNYKYFEIYQKVKYNYLQIGTGFGYNRWYKKHHFSATVNFMYNVITQITISSYFTPNSSYNDNDTSRINLVKNFKSRDVNTSNAFYANLKFTYSYSISEKVLLHFSLNSSIGMLDNSSIRNEPAYGSSYFGYYVYYQKIIYPSLGINFKLK